MRTLKFRAWSHRDRCWCGAFSIHKSGLFTENPNNDWVDLSEQEDIVLMQYTGLKDKNNKEIYEGDILKIPSFEEGYILSEVRWNDEMARFIINNHGSNKIVEVIGNKYENPELIKT